MEVYRVAVGIVHREVRGDEALALFGVAGFSLLGIVRRFRLLGRKLIRGEV